MKRKRKRKIRGKKIGNVALIKVHVKMMDVSVKEIFYNMTKKRMKKSKIKIN